MVSLQGHLTSSSPAAKGLPTEWTQGTNSPSLPNTSKTALPILVMILMFTTTNGLSVNSTPICAIGDPRGPIEKGTTYIVLPFMAPVIKPFMVERISTGSIQLFVGPACSFFSQQINVLSSTRATSVGSEQAQ